MMKTYTPPMEIVMVAGLVVLFMSMQFVPSSAQQNTPFCFDRIETCNRGAKTPMQFQQVCCPVVLQIVSNEIPCFCSIKSSLNATAVDDASTFLTVCNVTASFNTICPGGPTPSPSTPGTPPAPSPGPNSSPNVMPSAPPGLNSSPSDAPSTPTLTGSTESPNSLSQDGNTTDAGAANKIGMAGSLSSLLVLLTCVLF